MQLPRSVDVAAPNTKNEVNNIDLPIALKGLENFRMLGSNVMDRVMAQINYLNDSLLRQAEEIPVSLKEFGSPRNVGERPRIVEKELGALRSGALFKGEQMCGQSQYHVTVSLKHVDISDCYLCGYLTIENLTIDHPVLTTFFEGQIIDGVKHGFQTGTWNANRQADVDHWLKFDNFAAQYGIQYIDDEQPPIDIIHEPFIYQRWKEYFLVPDHRVEKVEGASYDGFYYMSYETDASSFTGFYYSKDSDRFQRIELNHVSSNTHPSYTFR